MGDPEAEWGRQRRGRRLKGAKPESSAADAVGQGHGAAAICAPPRVPLARPRRRPWPSGYSRRCPSGHMPIRNACRQPPLVAPRAPRRPAYPPPAALRDARIPRFADIDAPDAPPRRRRQAADAVDPRTGAATPGYRSERSVRRGVAAQAAMNTCERASPAQCSRLGRPR